MITVIYKGCLHMCHAVHNIFRLQIDKLRFVILLLSFSQVCHDVCLEPGLQKLDNEHFQLCIWTANTDDNARLDISANGFWERSERALYRFLILLLQLTLNIS